MVAAGVVRSVHKGHHEQKKPKAAQKAAPDKSVNTTGTRKTLNQGGDDLNFTSEFHVQETALETYGRILINLVIVVNFLALGLQADHPDWTFWIFADHTFTTIFALEMVIKIVREQKDYFTNRWHLFDFMLAWLGIFDVWILASMDTALRQFSAIRTLRLIRIFRLIRVIEIKKDLVVLVEGLWASIKSLGWLSLLLIVVIYTGALFVKGAVDSHPYDPTVLDTKARFGTTFKAMMTVFNMCIVADWTDIIWPIYNNQPHVFIFILALLTIVTFGILNLVIGVIAERTMAKTQEVMEEEEAAQRRHRMQGIVHMANTIFQDDSDGGLDADEMTQLVCETNPELLELLQSCDLPRGFDIGDLHLIFDEEREGKVSKEEFLDGMFRLIFNNEFQRSVCILNTVAQVKAMVKDGFDEIKQTLHSLSLPTHATNGTSDMNGNMESELSKAAETVAEAGANQPETEISPDPIPAPLQGAFLALEEAQRCLREALLAQPNYVEPLVVKGNGEYSVCCPTPRGVLTPRVPRESPRLRGRGSSSSMRLAESREANTGAFGMCSPLSGWGGGTDDDELKAARRQQLV